MSEENKVPTWRMFHIDDADEKKKHGAREIMRMHLMENATVSYAFVEQRVSTRSRTQLEDPVQWYVFGPNIAYAPVPSLRHGMDTIEWLWKEGVHKP